MNSKYFCYNLVDLCSEINIPLRQSQRIQYTCLDASSNYIVLGATSGSIYLFQRGSTVKFLQIIQNMYGPINHIAISPQEKFVTFSTVKGTICVYVIDLTASYPQIVTAHYKDALVTCLQWKRNEEQLFYGDHQGNVYVVNLTSFLGRNLTNISIHPILFLESPIVEISDLDKLLLVSNYTKCILCNTESEEFKQIGNTPRDGYYGACFLPAQNKINLANAKVFCARPGSRLWEVDVEGRVIQTSQYNLAASCPPTPSFNSTQHTSASPLVPAIELDSELTPGELKKTPQLLHRLQPIFGKYIFSYNRNGFYIFDPSRTTIVMWNDQIRDIQTVRIVNGSTLIIFTNHSQVFSIHCRSLEDGFIDMLAEQQLEDCLRLLLIHQPYFQELCLTQGYVTNILKLKNLLEAQEIDIAEECVQLLSEFADLIDPDDIPTSIDQHIVRHENGVFSVDNVYASNIRYKNSSNVDDNIKTVLLSASRNIFNKLNIFNELPDSADNLSFRPNADADDVFASHIIIPYQNIDTTNHSDEIVAPNFARTRRSTHQSTTNQPLTTEEKLLQNLFMIYKSSRISNLPLVERYAHIFDQYDYVEMREVLRKLCAIMQANHMMDATTANIHCYEMYFNYLNPNLVFEFDDAMRQYVIDGFVLLNQETDEMIVGGERCPNCDYPLYLPAVELRVKQFEELGHSILKYFWTRNESERCYELAKLVPWTMELCCKFRLQEMTSDSNALLANQQTLVHLFASGSVALLQSAIDQTDGFTYLLWDKYLALMVQLHTDHRMQCPQKCNEANSVAVDINTDRLLANDFYSWQRFLDAMVQSIRGRSSIALVRKYGSRISDNDVPKAFYLKCLLVP